MEEFVRQTLQRVVDHTRPDGQPKITVTLITLEDTAAEYAPVAWRDGGATFAVTYAVASGSPRSAHRMPGTPSRALWLRSSVDVCADVLRAVVGDDAAKLGAWGDSVLARGGHALVPWLDAAVRRAPGDDAEPGVLGVAMMRAAGHRPLTGATPLVLTPSRLAPVAGRLAWHYIDAVEGDADDDAGRDIWRVDDVSPDAALFERLTRVSSPFVQISAMTATE